MDVFTTKRRGVFFLLLFSISFTLIAQERTIVGMITDNQKEPILGATINIKGQSGGTISDLSGRYSIKADPTATLVFSFIGMETTEVPVNNQTVVNVTIEDKSVQLNEIVAVGYGTVKRKDLTGSVAKLNMSDALQAPVVNIDQALEGRLAGVEIISPDGSPNAVSQVVIRGGSLSQDASPLFIVDGIPMDNFDMKSLDAYSIESIEVLKDASSIAIYGSRGANGVIIISSKKASAGKPRVSYSYSLSENFKPASKPMMNAYDWVKLQLQLANLSNTGTSTQGNKTLDMYLGPLDPTSNTRPRTLDFYKTQPTIDWTDLITHNSLSQSHNLTIGGGSDNLFYNLSATYLDADGLVINSGTKKYSLKADITQRLTDNLKLNVMASYNSTQTHTNTAIQNVNRFRPVQGYNELNIIGAAVDSLTLNNANSVLTASDLVNPLQQAINEISLNTLGLTTLNAKLEWKFLTDFYFTSSVGGTFTGTETSTFYNSKTIQGSLLKNLSGTLYNTNGVNGSVQNKDVSNLLNENILGYRKRFNKNHSLDAIVGFTYQKSELLSNQSKYTNIAPEFEYLSFNSLSSGTPAVGNGQYTSQNQLASYLGRVNYNLMDKYIFTLTTRADGSSKFIKSSQWGVFPSGAFAWRFSNEKFMTPISDVLSDGKLRASYGVVGNNRGVSDFSYLVEFGSIEASRRYMFNDANLSTGVTQYFMSNPNLTWESAKELDLGMDVTLWKNRISLTVDYFDKTTSNILMSRTLPSYMGFINGSRYENTGSISNRGLEFTINTLNVSAKDFSWSTNFNISFNTSKVLSFYEGNNVLTMGNTGFTPAEGWIAEVGGEISQFYGYKFLRLYQQSDFTKAPNGANVLNPGIPSYAIKHGYQLSPGDPMYADINGDGKIDDTDRTTLGSPNPKFLGGFSNTLNYQNWSFSFFFKYSFGNKVLNYTSFTESAPGSTWRNMPATYNNRWTGDNTNTTISRLILNGLTDVSTNPGKLSSLYVEDGSFLRLNSVALSYKIPKKLLQKFGVEALGITFSAYNLWTLTNYSGNSPEASTMNVYAPPMGTGYSEITNSTPYSSMTRGYDRNATPRPINVSLAINLKF